MCDRAGIDALWVWDDLAGRHGQPRLEAWTAITLAGLDTSRGRVGAMLNVALRPPAILAAMAGTLDLALGGRLEIGLSGGQREHEQGAFGIESLDPAEGVRRLEEYATAVRKLTAGGSAALGTASPQSGGPPLALEGAGPPQIRVAVRMADDVLIPAMTIKEIKRVVGDVRKACEGVGRDPSSLGIGVTLPVSIGRTVAEAHARAAAEALFQRIGHPSEVGIFGTLEECQDRVISLAHLGVTDLRCVLPNAPDVHDVIAQLTAMVVGTVKVLTPGSPRSKAPEPPPGWGGRPPRQ